MAWDTSLNVPPTGHNFNISLHSGRAMIMFFWWYLNLGLSRYLAVYVPTNASSIEAELRKTLWWEVGFNIQWLPNIPEYWKFGQDGIRHIKLANKLHWLVVFWVMGQIRANELSKHQGSVWRKGMQPVNYTLNICTATLNCKYLQFSLSRLVPQIFVDSASDCSFLWWGDNNSALLLNSEQSCHTHGGCAYFSLQWDEKSVAEGLVISIVTADSQVCQSLTSPTHCFLDWQHSMFWCNPHCMLQCLGGGACVTQMKEDLAQLGKVKEDVCLLYEACKSIPGFGTFGTVIPEHWNVL